MTDDSAQDKAHGVFYVSRTAISAVVVDGFAGVKWNAPNVNYLMSIVTPKNICYFHLAAVNVNIFIISLLKMVSWSALGRSFGTNLFKNNLKTVNTVQNVNFSLAKTLKGDHGHKTMALQPSRWQWHKFKDMFHYYLMVGLIPVGAIIFYTTVFIGPATLTPIPDDYVPKHWEYHRHPITRFIARYIHNSPQQEYEKFLHYIDEEAQRGKLRALTKEVNAKMGQRSDYQAYYYRPMVNKYLRISKQVGDEIYDRAGDDE